MPPTPATGLVERLRTEIQVYRRALNHPRTPRAARWLLGMAVAYLVSPIDIIPDFIPFAGQLDDLIIVPLLVWLALRLIPREIMAECRQDVERQRPTGMPL